MQTHFSRAKSRPFASRSLRVARWWIKIKDSPAIYDSLSLSEKLVDCTERRKNPKREGTPNEKKKTLFPKSTLAKQHATVRAPLRLFGQFRLEHEIVPLHIFLNIGACMFELIEPFELRCVCPCYACFQLRREKYKNRPRAKKIWKNQKLKNLHFLSSLHSTKSDTISWHPRRKKNK